MPAKDAWAFGHPNKNFSDRTLVVQVGATQPAMMEGGTGPGTGLVQGATPNNLEKQGAHEPELAFELPVCSVVLAGSSEYFRVELEKYRKPGEPVVVMVEDGQQDLFRMLIRFMYTEKLRVDDAVTLLRMLLLAQRFTVDDCVLRCAEALSKPGWMSLEAALEICQRAAQQECLGDTFSNLCKLAADVLLDKFRDLDAVWANKERRETFLALPVMGLKVLLGHADLQVRSENTVFLATAWWLERHGDAGRLASFAELHALIRWSQMTSSYLQIVFFEVAWLISWEEADHVRLNALHDQLAHDAAKEVMHRASPKLAPRPRPGNSDVWPSVVIKVSESEFRLLDEHVADGVGDGKLMCKPDQALHVAGYAARPWFQIYNGRGGKGLAIFVNLNLPMPGRPCMLGNLALAVYSWKVTMRTARNNTTVVLSDDVDPSKRQRGRSVLKAPLTTTGDRQEAPVTRALQDAGFIKDGFLKLCLQVTCAS